MLNENTEMLQVIKNQNNSKELFCEWNTDNKTNIKCAVTHCDNDVNNNAYIVQKNIYTQRQYIVPLCIECYEKENNNKNQSTEDIRDIGTFISVNKNLLLEKKN